jgi:tRNA A-37 threonylcarbamoyl transferase component Bud32
MNNPNKCPRCDKETPANAPEGLCPSCLVEMNVTGGPPSDAGPISGTGTGTGSGRPAPLSVEEVARLFPEMEILGLLGAGGMGAVYKARQPKLDRLVALKVLDQRGRDPRFVERFGREARTLARLNHPNIVAVHDFGEREGIFFLTMDFVDGVTLRELLGEGKLAPEQALAIVPQICEALQYAHGKGVVHRDIKPENILLDTDGRVKVADFGIARLAGAAPEPNLTAAGEVVGTAHYMAPEQVERPREVDHRADIFALGVVFYEMLTGELPLGKFQPPSKKVQVDVRLDEVVLHALEKEPERRYQRAVEVKTDVETIAGSPARASPHAGVGGEVRLGWRDRWLWQRQVMAFGFFPSAALLLVVPFLVWRWGDEARLAVTLIVAFAIFGMALSAIHGWLGHRIAGMKSALPLHRGEVADAWIGWSDGMWPFNRSQGVAVLHNDRLELHPAWYGTVITVPIAEVASVREVRWMYMRYFWKHCFRLRLKAGGWVAVAVAAPFGRRWRARLSGGKLPVLPESEPLQRWRPLSPKSSFMVMFTILGLMVASVAGWAILHLRSPSGDSNPASSHTPFTTMPIVLSDRSPAVQFPNAPPVVVTTFPESGAAGVDPAIMELRVTFSKPMQDGSWSWVNLGDGTFPEMTDKPRYLGDGQTCVLPVKLEPGKVYATWINFNPYLNFQDTEGRPSVPYLLIFGTRD